MVGLPTPKKPVSFTQSPKGATSNYTLKGTAGVDITTIAAGDTNVKLYGYGEDDQVTLQSTDGYATKFTFAMGEGDDRVMADADPNGNQGQFWVRYSSFNGDQGNDILFADDAGLADSVRTASLLYTTIGGGNGFDLIRLYGALNSVVNGDKDNDTIELGYVDDNGKDRYNGSTIKGGAGQDVIRVDTGDLNVVDVLIQGDSGADYIHGDITRAVSGLWTGSIIDGGNGNDDIEFQNATSSLSIVGGKGNDLIKTGTGNDTINGGDGNDKIKIQGGANEVFAGSGNDRVEIFGKSTFRGNSNVLLASGNDVAVVENDGNHFIEGAAGNDFIEVIGTGTSLVTGNDGNDEIVLLGSSGTANGGAGNDVIEVETAGNVLLLGESGNDAIGLIDGASQASGEIEAGNGADFVYIEEATGTTTVVQLDGQSVAATKFNDTPSGADRNIRGEWSDGDTITFGRGVDLITGFQQDLDVFDTTLGDQGLDETLNGGLGGLYDAFETSPFDGMVFNRSYYLRGFYNLTGPLAPNGVNAGTFTVNANGTDSLVYTQGNNGRPTDNANAIVMLDFDASSLTFANII